MTCPCYLLIPIERLASSILVRTSSENRISTSPCLSIYGLVPYPSIPQPPRQHLSFFFALSVSGWACCSSSTRFQWIVKQALLLAVRFLSFLSFFSFWLRVGNPVSAHQVLNPAPPTSSVGAVDGTNVLHSHSASLFPPPGQAIEAGGSTDDDTDEFTPSEIDGASVASTSITSSVYEHIMQNGRRYHRFRHGRYPIPNDETEQDREDMLHAMMLEATNGKFFYAPIKTNPQKIIDLGTGTGIWAIEGTFSPRDLRKLLFSPGTLIQFVP